MKIAIIGGGAAGMTAAYLLNNSHHVTVFEKQPILGGNIRTLNKNVTNVDLPPNVYIDNGVIEFQQDRFIYFHKLMKKLGVQTEPIRGGSTALFFDNSRYISAPGVIRDSQLSFIQRTKAYGKLWPILLDYRRFLSRTKTPADWVSRPMSHFWRDDVWSKWQRMLLMYGYSIPFSLLDDFPAEIGVATLRQSGHGTAWTRVVGGVYTYIEKILETFNGDIHLDTQINSIHRSQERVSISLPSGLEMDFDKVIFATPPDQVLALLADPTAEEQRRFGDWRPNHATTLIHTDMSIYRPYGIAHFSEFDLFEKKSGEDAGYNAYLNRLCGLSPGQETHYNLAYNLEEQIEPSKVIHRQEHHTPLYTTSAIEHRKEVVSTNGERNTYHAGAWLGNGLHEGAIESAVAVAQLLGGAQL